MRNRLKLHKLFLAIVPNVYHQAPTGINMSYPCIRYELTDKDARHANNKKYIKTNCYMVTIIDKNPDSEIPDKLEELQYCEFDRRYQADGMNHWVYRLYY